MVDNFNHLSIFENIILGIDPDMKQTQTNFKIVKDIMKKVSLNIDLHKKNYRVHYEFLKQV